MLLKIDHEHFSEYCPLAQPPPTTCSQGFLWKSRQKMKQITFSDSVMANISVKNVFAQKYFRKNMFTELTHGRE